MLTPAILFRREKGPGGIVYYRRSGAINYVDREIKEAVSHAIVEEPPELAGIDASRAILGRQAEEFLSNARPTVTLLLFPTGKCLMSCDYCKARSSDELDFRQVVDFVQRHRVREVRVFGGEPLLAGDVLANLSLLPVKLVVSTGMGIEETAFRAGVKALCSRSYPIEFVVSIDPPPSSGGKYTKSYPCAGSWYLESLRRFGWVSKVAPTYVKAVISRHCYSYRTLIDDLWKAGPLRGISLSIVNNSANSDIAPTQETYAALIRQLEHDVQDSVYGHTAEGYWAYPTLARARDIVDPETNFIADGCYNMHQRINLGADGSLGLCYCGDSKVGTLSSGMDLDAYAGHAWKCLSTANVAEGRVWCPTSGVGNMEEKTIFHHLQRLAMFRYIANLEHVEDLPRLFSRRAAVLRRWQEQRLPTLAECRDRVGQLVK